MPELPEVETTRLAISPHIIGQKVENVIIRQASLRWPIPQNLKKLLYNREVENLTRRGKYLLLHFRHGTLILHLGMSGRLHLQNNYTTAKKHDHVDIYFTNNTYLRFNDPRRFGALLWTPDPAVAHPLLKHLGPEPLTKAFDGNYLFVRAGKRKLAVKSFIMDSKTVTGVGNIYAQEALFIAGLRPDKAAGRVKKSQYTQLAQAIKVILKKAILKGGTTLKDYLNPNGKPGYFSIDLKVYGRGSEPCLVCQTKLKSLRIGTRSTVFCPHCQR